MNLRPILPPAVLTSAVLASLTVAATAQAQTARGARAASDQPVTAKISPVTNADPASTTAATSPVGFMTTACLANTDTNLTIPFTRPAAFVGAATSGANAANNTGTITFSGTPFTASAYKYVQGTQATHYYAYVTGGTKEGAIYDIADNTANSLTINTNGDSINTLASGTQVRIIPHWTLATAFTVGQSVIGATTFVNAPTQILVPDQATAGTDLVAAATYFYYSGTAAGGPGWRRLGGTFSAIYDDTVLYPETYFVLRNNTASNLSFVPVGSVSTLSAAVTSSSAQTVGVNVATVLNTLAANTDQDNAIGLPVAVDTTLDGSNLYQSGAFTGQSVFFGGTGDQLLVYDNTASGTDKAASKTYFYYNGSAAGGAGWRQLGEPFTALHNTDVLKAGAGFIVRKRGTATPTSVVWNYRPIITP